MKEQQPILALMVFIGGLSAATGMITSRRLHWRPWSATTSSCRCFCAWPLASVGAQGSRRHPADDPPRHDYSRGAARLCLCSPDRRSYALVTIGLVSFAAAMQFVPAIVGGIYWKGATKAGALAGLTGGFRVWIYTLLLLSSPARIGFPKLRRERSAGNCPAQAVRAVRTRGARPDLACHDWTMLNVGLLVAVSLMTSSVIERSQAAQFVDIFKRTAETARVWRGRATIGDLRQLLVRFIGEVRANAAFARFERESQRDLDYRVRPTPTSSPIGASARRRHRRRLRPHHGRIGAEGGDARHRPGPANPR